MSLDTSEKGFQKDFINYLTSTGYVKRTTKDYDTITCLDVELVLKFIHTTQLKAWKKFVRINKSNPEANFISSLMRRIAKYGTIDVLRNGFRDAGTKFELFYPMPNNNLNPELKAKFNQNIFSVIDELEYEIKIMEIDWIWLFLLMVFLFQLLSLKILSPRVLKMLLNNTKTIVILENNYLKIVLFTLP